MGMKHRLAAGGRHLPGVAHPAGTTRPTMQDLETHNDCTPDAAPVKPLSVLLVYPNTREVALANLGFQRVHELLNRIDGVVCDRYALPNDWKPGAKRLKEHELLSHETHRRPRDFDVIAFSISFEPDYLHAAALLGYFGLPLRRKDRGPGFPLVAAGGSAVFINPEPLADCVDLFFIGEGEGMAERFFAAYRGPDQEDRPAALRRAARVSGIYVPELYEPLYEEGRLIGYRADPEVPARVVRHYTEEPGELITHSTLHGEASTFRDMTLLEVTRGCIWACRFCTAGFIYRPPRLPDLQSTLDSLDRSLEGGERPSTVGLVGPSVTDHPDLTAMAKKIVERGQTLSFSSLRMETLTDELVDLILQSGQKTITVAVDAPSKRMRDVVNKAATDEAIIEKCRFLTAKGILHLKIYSIIGLPGETDEDIDQFIALVKNVMQVYVEECQKRGNIGKVTISLGPLIPKPGTPFQFHPMEAVAVLKKKIMKVRRALGGFRQLKLGMGSPREAFLQTYLSRGDRRLADFFEAYLENGEDARAALGAVTPEPEQVVYRQYQKDDFLPWDIIDHGYRDDFLWRDYQRGLAELHTPVCDTATCKICGVC